MAKKLVVVPVPVVKAPLAPDKVRAMILEFKALGDSMADIEKRKKAIQGELVVDLGVKGVVEFGLIRAVVVQAWGRKIPWKELAVELAKEFMTKMGFRRWLKGLADKFPKKANSAFVKLSLAKGTIEDGPVKIERGLPPA